MHNHWIPVTDLLSGFVVVCLLLFVSASVNAQLLKRQQIILEEERIKAEQMKGLSIEEKRTRRFAKLKEKLRAAEEKNLMIVDTIQRTIELKNLSFQSGSACLSQPAKKAIESIQSSVIEDMVADPLLNIYLEGHTDPVPIGKVTNSCGWFDNNTQLSTLRAANVRELLVSDEQVEIRARMPVTGWGPDRLKNKAEPRNEVNRRVELKWIWE
jgi:flagellar motor protein MotB